MSRKNDDELTLIIRRKKIPAGGGHAAAWKIAYADFVTAMMSFFLLLWLLNSSTVVDLDQIGNSFTPGDDHITEISATGKSGISGGSTNEKINDQNKDQEVVDHEIQTDDPIKEQAIEQFIEKTKITNKEFSLQGDNAEQTPDLAMSETQDKLQQAIRKIEADNPQDKVNTRIFIDNAGLNIEFISEKDQRTFRRNSAEMTQPLRNTLFRISRLLANLTQPIIITGHSAKEASFRKSWSLSILRADTIRQGLIRMGVPENRIFAIGGKGYSLPVEPDNLSSTRNIRIQITLLSAKGHLFQEQAIRSATPQVKTQ